MGGTPCLFSGVFLWSNNMSNYEFALTTVYKKEKDSEHYKNLSNSIKIMGQWLDYESIIKELEPWEIKKLDCVGVMWKKKAYEDVGGQMSYQRFVEYCKPRQMFRVSCDGSLCVEKDVSGVNDHLDNMDVGGSYTITAIELSLFAYDKLPEFTGF